MYRLNEQQIDSIAERLEKEKITSKKLEEDLLDHFCCYMEEEMQKGADFEQAYKKAAISIIPNGIKEIEFELYFLMNFHKQLSMKKIIFFSGFFSLFLLSTGLMFKTLYWPGAQIILISGFVVLLLTIFTISFYLLLFSKRRPLTFWLRTLSGLIALFLITIGFIFKNFNLSGAHVLYGLGTIVLNFIFLPLFFFHTYKFGFAKNQ